jgi:hypothetical protein
VQHGGGGWSANVFFAFSAKSVTEKNNSRVDCAEADKKTVQALHFGMLSELTRKGGDF